MGLFGEGARLFVYNNELGIAVVDILCVVIGDRFEMLFEDLGL